MVERITDIKISGLVAHLKLSVRNQHITSIVSTDLVRELRLKRGQTTIALLKSTEFMIVQKSIEFMIVQFD